jgi:N-acetylglutamate synthase-like GNAT family acetyltransferase
MDTIDLSLKMKRLTAWLDTQNQPDGLVGRRFHGVPFADAYVTIDPEHQTPYASANLNRVHLCGTEPGMSADGIRRLIDVFADHHVRRFFVWLSPGPDMDMARGWLDQAGFSRVRRTGYPTMCREGHAPAHVETDLDIRQVGPDDIAASRDTLGETLWPAYVTSAGRDGFVHYMAFDGRRPVAIAALCMFEDIGYLMAAATAEADRRRGAQQALIATRVAQAERQGCAMLVSETLHMLEHSYRNLQRAGFEEVYDKEVYEWNA